jgi:tRNA pseudouridine13 synthase
VTSATIRKRPEDFVVEELPAYLPSGRGEHLFVTFTKTGLTTLDAVRAIAMALDVSPRDAGYAGMKDRHAVTTQTASFSFPIARDADAAVAALSVPGIQVLSAARHDNKLKPGHLEGNRFTIALRDVDGDIAALERALLEAARVGVPNAFGPQRFGRDGDNPERALAWLAGRARGPRDKREQRLLFSSLQSRLFNEVLDRRIADGTWSAVLPGDVAKKHDSGGLFTVPLEGAELDDARARADAGTLSATGPMFGAKMRWPEGAPLALEREVLEGTLPGPEGTRRLEELRHLGEGTRRSLRLPVIEMRIAAAPPAGSGQDGAAADSGSASGAAPRSNAGESDAQRERPRDVSGTPDGPEIPAPAGAGLVISFVLPKGGYATTVLGRACTVVDFTRLPRAWGEKGGDQPPGTRGDPSPETSHGPGGPPATDLEEQPEADG